MVTDVAKIASFQDYVRCGTASGTSNDILVTGIQCGVS